MSIRLEAFFKAASARVLTPEPNPDLVEIERGYVSDLLSDVMGAAGSGMCWITIMRHLNVVAVAALAGIRAVVFAKGVVPDQAVIDKATAEGVVLAVSELDSFSLAGVLYKLLNE